MTSSTSTAPPLTAARASSCAACSRARAPRATPSSSRPRSSTSTSPISTPSSGPVPIDRGSYFDLLPDDIGSQLRRRTRAHPRGDGHRRRARPARRRPGPARDRPALHRRAHHGRHGDVACATSSRSSRARADVAASFMPKPLVGVQGSGHAHAPLAVARRAERLHRRAPLRTERPRDEVHRRVSCATRPRSRRSPTSG